MADSVLTSEVKEVLSRATVNGNVLLLPPGQLDRKLYESVDKALKNAGGKWKRGTGHVFPSDAAPKLAAMLGAGVSVDEKKRDQAFFTPPELAVRIVALANVQGQVALEPSLAVSCFELNPEYVNELRRKRYTVIQGDFLHYSPAQGAQFQRIVMNPPFTKNQDIKHVRHALKWLAPRGILVAIMPNNQTRKGFMELVAEYDPEIEELERGVFKESGTDVPTLIVKIEVRNEDKELRNHECRSRDRAGLKL